MILQKEYFRIFNIVYFVLDNVMFWEAFRWERLDMGYIYIQKFSSGKLYAGQTINLERRMNTYKKLKGNNKHHTSALKKRIDTMQIAFTRCPNYLLDTVEIFVIAFFDLANRAKGYNKTTGGRQGYRVSKETRMNISIAKRGKPRSEEVRAKLSESQKGEKGYWFGKTLPEETRVKMSAANSGENCFWFGKTLPEEMRAKISDSLYGEKNPMFGKTHTEESRSKMSVSHIGKTHTEEVRAKMSETRKRGKHPNSKPICVFGKLYDSASTASDILREVCMTTSDNNFIVGWAKRKKNQHIVFYVSKEFYNAMKDTAEIITHDKYEKWSDQL
ncbi:GIY-YIG catalytic domain-containing endonuclease [Acanthocystis turfacea Chlorella virus OR0704.3]|nr:GIY-YIG catalytic domain-containing endonuclease [Acanthocystis turfacea Chlorella virus OR0704.3]